MHQFCNTVPRVQVLSLCYHRIPVGRGCPQEAPRSAPRASCPDPQQGRAAVQPSCAAAKPLKHVRELCWVAASNLGNFKQRKMMWACWGEWVGRFDCGDLACRHRAAVGRDRADSSVRTAGLWDIYRSPGMKRGGFQQAVCDGPL